jgi:hypothetical protein
MVVSLSLLNCSTVSMSPRENKSMQCQPKGTPCCLVPRYHGRLDSREQTQHVSGIAGKSIKVPKSDECLREQTAEYNQSNKQHE